MKNLSGAAICAETQAVTARADLIDLGPLKPNEVICDQGIVPEPG